MRSEHPGRLAFSVAEVADHLHVSTDTIIRQIRSGELPAKKLGSRVLILAEDLKVFLDGLPRVS